ncbi:MAG TPA: DoxX family protein [Vicinamibacterales bacterium]|nr:DoxX family protein [Vicinamibacterales bacterium]
MTRRRIGYILSGIAILFLSFDTAVKLLHAAPAVQANAQLGLPEPLILVVGLIELACLIAYAVPPTALIGAVLFTGYLGGAIALQLRVGNPLLSHTLFPTYVAALIWGGLLLRHPRLVGILTGERT